MGSAPEPPLNGVLCALPGSAGPDCDRIVGSAASGRGICADPLYRHSILCACVNSPSPLPECTTAACRDAGAYMPTRMAATVCPPSPVCQQWQGVEGEGNTLQDALQQCGYITEVSYDARYLFLAFLLVVGVALVAFGAWAALAEEAPPGPPPGRLSAAL